MSDNEQQSYEEWLAELNHKTQAMRSGKADCPHFSTRIDLAGNKQTCNVCGASWPIIDDETRRRMEARRNGG